MKSMSFKQLQTQTKVMKSMVILKVGFTFASLVSLLRGLLSLQSVKWRCFTLYIK